jgi:hypothetical protein
MNINTLGYRKNPMTMPAMEGNILKDSSLARLHSEITMIKTMGTAQRMGRVRCSKTRHAIKRERKPSMRASVNWSSRPAICARTTAEIALGTNQIILAAMKGIPKKSIVYALIMMVVSFIMSPSFQTFQDVLS